MERPTKQIDGFDTEELWVRILFAAVPWIQPFDKELLNKIKEDAEQNGV